MKLEFEGVKCNVGVVRSTLTYTSWGAVRLSKLGTPFGLFYQPWMMSVEQFVE
jgi:hypothetical protein